MNPHNTNSHTNLQYLSPPSHLYGCSGTAKSPKNIFVQTNYQNSDINGNVYGSSPPKMISNKSKNKL
jgi:hypothetical protein